MRYLLGLATVALMGVTGLASAQTDPCEVARCAVQTQLAQCPCSSDGSTNHGQYVSCVAHVINQIAKDPAGQVPKNCKGKIKRCAARSTCGKPGFVTCQIPEFGTCNAGTCVENGLPCTSDTDCGVIGTRCKIKHSADLCQMAGGTVGTGTSCCATCL